MSKFKIADMTCGHCEKAIKAELFKANANAAVEVDLKSKVVTIHNIPDDQVLFVLQEIGYNPEKVE